MKKLITLCCIFTALAFLLVPVLADEPVTKGAYTTLRSQLIQLCRTDGMEQASLHYKTLHGFYCQFQNQVPAYSTDAKANRTYFAKMTDLKPVVLACLNEHKFRQLGASDHTRTPGIFKKYQETRKAIGSMINGAKDAAEKLKAGVALTGHHEHIFLDFTAALDQMQTELNALPEKDTPELTDQTVRRLESWCAFVGYCKKAFLSRADWSGS